jgi:hypothetical protein
MSLPAIMTVFQDVLARLEEAKIPYMVVGSLSSIVYGEPRMTKDMDIVVDVPAQDASKFEFYFPFSGFYCPPGDILKDEIVNRGQFNLIHHESGLKIDVIVRKQSPHSIEEFKRRKKISFWKGFEAFIASPEDVIIKKLDFFREGGSEKHITDIRGILASTELDRAYLEKWIQSLGLETVWQKVTQ